jgi:hypothetical protein
LAIILSTFAGRLADSSGDSRCGVGRHGHGVSRVSGCVRTFKKSTRFYHFRGFVFGPPHGKKARVQM